MQNSGVGKQLLHTFIGNYCWRSHIGGAAEFQEKKKPGSYVTSARSWQGPRNRAAQARETRTQPQWLPRPLIFINTHTSRVRAQSQCPLSPSRGAAGETPYRELSIDWDNRTPRWQEKRVRKVLWLLQLYYCTPSFTFLYDHCQLTSAALLSSFDVFYLFLSSN